jgi:hypothetical protein
VHLLVCDNKQISLCLLRGRNRILKHDSSEESPCETDGGQSGNVQVFVRVVPLYPVSIILTMPHTRLHLHVALTRRTNERSLGTF